MKALKKPYVYWTVGIFLAYLLINVVLSKFYLTAKYLFIFSGQLNWWHLVISAILSLVIASLVALNSVQSYIKYKQRKEVGTACAINGVGTIFGFATGICSSCVAGVIPIILSWLGIVAGWATLPLQGIEVQIFTILILLVSFYYLN